jgi:hypothetical protein
MEKSPQGNQGLDIKSDSPNDTGKCNSVEMESEIQGDKRFRRNSSLAPLSPADYLKPIQINEEKFKLSS